MHCSSFQSAQKVIGSKEERRNPHPLRMVFDSCCADTVECEKMRFNYTESARLLSNLKAQVFLLLQHVNYVC